MGKGPREAGEGPDAGEGYQAAGGGGPRDSKNLLLSQMCAASKLPPAQSDIDSSFKDPTFQVLQDQRSYASNDVITWWGGKSARNFEEVP